MRTIATACFGQVSVAGQSPRNFRKGTPVGVRHLLVMRATRVPLQSISLILATGAVWLFGAGCSGSEPTEGTPVETPAMQDAATGQAEAAVSMTPETPAPRDTPTAQPEPTPSGRVSLNAVGDLMLGRDIITLMDENGSMYPFVAVHELLADADITIANMEGTFTDRGVPADKFYTFRTPPRHAVGLAEAGIDVVSLGNNHTMDFGTEGLEDTLAALAEAGVLHSGAGRNAADARLPVTVERNGLKIAFLSYNEIVEATFAGPETAGVAMADQPSIEADVEAALGLAQVVVVSLHAGIEYTDQPGEQQRRLAMAAIDAGAALVLGHHAHVFQGWQAYNGGVIAWGLGNFVFDLDFEDLGTLGPRPFQTAVLRFELTAAGVESVSARPVYIDPAQNRPVPAEGEQLAEVEARIRQVNGALQ